MTKSLVSSQNKIAKRPSTTEIKNQSVKGKKVVNKFLFSNFDYRKKLKM